MPVGSDEAKGANSKTPITKERAIIALLKFPFLILKTSTVYVDQSHHVCVVIPTIFGAK
jgi:hypothetical protein